MALSDRLPQALAEHLTDLQRVRNLAVRQRDAMAAGNAELTDLTSIVSRASYLRVDIVDIKSRTGIVQFVRNHYGRPLMDIVARYNAIQSALETLITTIRNGAPTGAGGYVLAFQWSAGTFDANQLVWRTFTPAQTATVQSNLTALIVAIDALFDDLVGLT